VLWKLIPEEQTRYQRIHETSMLRSRPSIDLNDKMLVRKTKSFDGFFHGTPQQLNHRASKAMIERSADFSHQRAKSKPIPSRVRLILMQQREDWRSMLQKCNVKLADSLLQSIQKSFWIGFYAPVRFCTSKGKEKKFDFSNPPRCSSNGLSQLSRCSSR
jgi:hypothetical protein